MRFVVVAVLAVVVSSLSSSCTKPTAPPPPSQPAPAPAATVVTKYVQASTLKLRAAADASAAVRGRLDINSPVVVLEQQGTFTKVRVANGREGFVGSEFLGDSALTVDAARAKAAATNDVEVRLSWLQRATAIEPENTALLTELRDAYVVAHNDRAAGIVASLLSTLNAQAGRLVALHDGRLEWHAFENDAAAAAVPAGAVALTSPAAHLDGARLHVLPKTAAARSITPSAAESLTWNECGGVSGVDVAYVGGAAHGVDSDDVVAFDGAPPASWQQAVTSWPAARLEQLRAQLQAKHCKGSASCEVGVVGTVGIGAVGRVIAQQPTKPDDDMGTWKVTDVVVDDKDAVVSENGRDEQGYLVPDELPVALRDVVGDAAAEVVWRGACGSSVTTLAGAAVFSSTGRCCGC